MASNEQRRAAALPQHGRFSNPIIEKRIGGILPTVHVSVFGVLIYVDSSLTVYSTHHAGGSTLPGDCCSSVECSSVVCSFCAVATAVPPRPEDGTVSVIVHFTSVQLTDYVTHRNCKVPQVPCNGLVREVSP